MGRNRWIANLEQLCQSLEDYCAAALPAAPSQSSAMAVPLSDSLYLANSASDAKFSAICDSGHLSSSARLRRPLSPKCPEVMLGTADSVFFYVSPFRYPHTGCGLLFAHSLESEHENEGVATPFDSGGLVNIFTRGNLAESPQEFLSRHELPIPEHRRYLCRSMDTLFQKPADYVEGEHPRRPGPIGLYGGDQRRWTHEVRIPDRVPLRGSHLQAVFAPKARIAANPAVEDLFQWCATEGVDHISFDTPRANDFEALRRECLAYIRRKLY
jgi:hypothetical protein